MPFDPAIEVMAKLLMPLPITWGFCGGWSIDLFVNRWRAVPISSRAFHPLSPL